MAKLKFETVSDFLCNKTLGLPYSTSISETLVIHEPLLKEKKNSARFIRSDFDYFYHNVI